MTTRSSRKPLDTYSRVQVGTAGPGKRVVMMYDGILKNLRQARALMSKLTPENIEVIHNSLQLSQKIILELQLALDHENGGEIAPRLDGLYSFWLEQLSEANLKKDASYVKNVMDMAKELRDAWEQAAKDAKRQGII